MSPEKVPWKAMTMAHITDFASVVRRPQRGAQKDILGRWRRPAGLSLSSSLPFESFAAKVFAGGILMRDKFRGERAKMEQGTVRKSSSRQRVQ